MRGEWSTPDVKLILPRACHPLSRVQLTQFKRSTRPPPLAALALLTINIVDGFLDIVAISCKSLPRWCIQTLSFSRILYVCLYVCMFGCTSMFTERCSSVHERADVCINMFVYNSSLFVRHLQGVRECCHLYTICTSFVLGVHATLSTSQSVYRTLRLVASLMTIQSFP